MGDNGKTYRGVPISEVYDRGSTNYRNGWKDGVDAHYDRTLELAAAQQDPTALKLTGWARQDVTAFAHQVQDNPDEARQIVRSLSPADRAVLQFHLHELSRIAEEEDSFRETEDRRRARLSYGDRPGAVPDGIGPFEIG